MKKKTASETFEAPGASLVDRFLAALQYPLPQHWLSRIVYAFMRIPISFVKNFQIRAIASKYGVNMSEAITDDLEAYRTFNEFFVRKLKPGARPIDPDPLAVVSPADSVVSQAGRIDGGRIFQAKGRSFTLGELLGTSSDDEPLAVEFRDGVFTTLYLSPKDYHRVHMPLAGDLREMIHIPGRLFSVNPGTTRAVPRLFARNERVVSIFETSAGPMAVILVGALFVSAIETVWAGLVTPPTRGGVRVAKYKPGTAKLAKGAEMGRFNMGSTVILLFKNSVAWDSELRPEAAVKIGEQIGALKK